MWFPESGSRRVMYLYVVVVLILVLLQIFGVGAIRVFPPNKNNAVPNNKVQFSHRIIFDDNNTNTNTNTNSNTRNRYEDLFKRYFAGRTTSAPTTTNNNNTTTTHTGFDDSKRRVPSCPDPLHN